MASRPQLQLQLPPGLLAAICLFVLGLLRLAYYQEALLSPGLTEQESSSLSSATAENPKAAVLHDVLVLWNAPLHSWTGVASEAMNFLVPLADSVPGLALVGGYVEDYVEEYSRVGDSGGHTLMVVEKLRHAGELASRRRAAAKQSIFITQGESPWPLDVQGESPWPLDVQGESPCLGCGRFSAPFLE
ncbi:hypothetical protein CYMTET_7340, partial [Cymbomonas tetramitiformis]